MKEKYYIYIYILHFGLNSQKLANAINSKFSLEIVSVNTFIFYIPLTKNSL